MLNMVCSRFPVRRKFFLFYVIYLQFGYEISNAKKKKKKRKRKLRCFVNTFIIVKNKNTREIIVIVYEDCRIEVSLTLNSMNMQIGVRESKNEREFIYNLI